MADAVTGWTGADGLPLHARRWPGGVAGAVPILCLHGLTRNGRDFGRLAPWLAARGGDAVAADMRGRGGSAWDPAARYGPTVYADDVLRLLDRLGWARAAIVGTSMGGLVAMALAERAPDRLAGAAVNDVGPAIEEAGLARIAAYVGQAHAFADWEEAAAHLRRHNGSQLPAFGPSDWAAMARATMAERDGRVVPDHDPAIARPAPVPPPGEPWAAWGALAATGPTLLLRGALSDILAPATADAMAARPGVRLVTVPAVGHAPTLDEPAARAALADWQALLG